MELSKLENYIRIRSDSCLILIPSCPSKTSVSFTAPEPNKTARYIFFFRTHVDGNAEIWGGQLGHSVARVRQGLTLVEWGLRISKPTPVPPV